MASAIQSLGEFSWLPLAGPYDFGALKANLLRGRLSDDQYKVKHIDLPLQCKFPPVMEGKQLRKFQKSWFSKYPWLTYSRSENGGYCAYCLAFLSSVRTGINLGALVQSPLVKFKKAMETLASHVGMPTPEWQLSLNSCLESVKVLQHSLVPRTQHRYN